MSSNDVDVDAPTIACSNADPQKLLNIFSNRNIIVIAGDFNAKTGSAWKNKHGKYGKGKVHENGVRPLEAALKYNLVLTNPLFQHKLCHRWFTWEFPERNNLDKDGTPRRNPYSN